MPSCLKPQPSGWGAVHLGFLIFFGLGAVDSNLRNTSSVLGIVFSCFGFILVFISYYFTIHILCYL